MGCCGNRKRDVSPVIAAKNLVFSLANALFHAARTGQVSAPKEVIENRMATCKACNDFRNGRCISCGCFLVIKTGMASENCPKGYWE